MSIPARRIVSAFMAVERQLASLLDVVPYTVEHLDVWSPALVPCIFEACSQLDSLWKSLAPTANDRLTIADHYKMHCSSVADRWLVLWADEGHITRPFGTWKSGAPWIRDQTIPPWWEAYNHLKHNRWRNAHEAKLRHAVDAVAGLFLAMARTPQCFEAMVEQKWLRAEYNPSYLLEKVNSAIEPTGAGMTWETSLFSYAAGSHHPEFGSHLAFYNQCSRRFGKWLERKYNGSFYLQ